MKSRRNRTRRQRGGYPAANPSSYTSASTYQMAVNGTGDAQYSRVFDINGVNGRNPGNLIVGVQGQNMGLPNHKGGKRHRSRKNRKGGNWGQIINQAVVPFGLLGMQQTFKKRKSTNRTRRYK